ncbi:C2H2-type Zn finger-containing protein [Heterostelium album PN500]|uniref:C2H2-type Zn finger-containing protein n=1 Tax=Heterostelium pallidum (strain ATCC 26659 / Pp 5 / PN500) TaxID=670386 RepID=D3B1B7_HETP5|nr:C2H2-type Zn finger-containing protein [Heterostelium album PN500]EFA85091.1 C2H2-type Zn finger-containing protein [Heterostelium album PN500]|eukprot:XP_020437200.1 C2H2-type Zn finger-containing protein [Heterostelium album PN500]
MSSEKKDFVDSTFRKKWDREYYEQRARDREAGLIADTDATAQQTKKQVTAPSVESLGSLEARTEDLNLMQRLGKVTVVNGVTPSSEQGGLYCEKCDVLLKDSVSMLDHYNSKKRMYSL